MIDLDVLCDDNILYCREISDKELFLKVQGSQFGKLALQGVRIFATIVALVLVEVSL